MVHARPGPGLAQRVYHVSARAGVLAARVVCPVVGVAAPHHGAVLQGRGQDGLHIVPNEVFTIIEKAPTRAFSWLKVPTNYKHFHI